MKKQDNLLKKIFNIISIFLLVAVLASCGQIGQDDIVILYTNDIHCAVDENIGYGGLAAYKKQMLKKTKYVSLIDAGDSIQGGMWGSVTNGKTIIDIMNHIDYEVEVPGNHEFDYGVKRFFELSSQLNCGYVSCNFRRCSDDALIFPAYKMIDYGKTKIAYVGVCTPESALKTAGDTFLDADGNKLYSFDSELIKDETTGKTIPRMYQSVQNAVDSARAEGADYVILVAHLGEKYVTEEWNSPHIVAATNGIDAVIDGHSHETTPHLKVKNKDADAVVITQTGTKLRRFGRIVIKNGAVSAQKQKMSFSLISSVDKGLKEIEDKELFENDAVKEIFAFVTEQIGFSDFDLVATGKFGIWLCRNGETNLGDFVADSLRIICDEMTCSEKNIHTDIGIVNGGGLRNNIGKGKITCATALNVLPFKNKICVYELTGQALLDELEFDAMNLPKNTGRFPHVSGVKYKVNLEEQYPNRVYDVFVNGEKLDLQKKYTLATSTFIAEGDEDGHSFAGLEKIYDTELTDFEILRKYIESFSGKIPSSYKKHKGQGRIVIK